MCALILAAIAFVFVVAWLLYEIGMAAIGIGLLLLVLIVRAFARALRRSRTATR